MPRGAMKRQKHEIINFHPKSQLVLRTAGVSANSLISDPWYICIQYYSNTIREILHISSLKKCTNPEFPQRAIVEYLTVLQCCAMFIKHCIKPLKGKI